MHSVLRNELIFLITFVWPLAIPLGLTALACLMSGMGGVRLIAALAAGREAWTQIPIALVELSGAALGVWSLRRVRDARSPLWF